MNGENANTNKETLLKTESLICPVSDGLINPFAIQIKQITHKTTLAKRSSTPTRKPQKCEIEWTPLKYPNNDFSHLNIDFVNKIVPCSTKVCNNLFEDGMPQGFEEIEERLLTLDGFIDEPKSSRSGQSECINFTSETWMQPNNVITKNKTTLNVGQHSVRLTSNQECDATEEKPISLHERPSILDTCVWRTNSRPPSRFSLEVTPKQRSSDDSDSSSTSEQNKPTSLSECRVPPNSRLANMSLLSTCAYHGSIIDPSSSKLMQSLPSSQPILSSTDESISEIQNHDDKDEDKRNHKTEYRLELQDTEKNE